MAKDEIPSPHPLPNKPLIEAIFELHWGLKEMGKGMPPHDPGFRIALGKYYDIIRQEYPVMVDLPTTQVPEDMTAYTVRHQFRIAEDKWPLTQLGPGILTVNDTEGYTWDTFEPRLQKAISAIYAAYPTDITPFIPQKAQLRYIDAIQSDSHDGCPIAFLRDFLHTKIIVDPLLFEQSDKANAPKHISLNLAFPLIQPKGMGTLTFSSGFYKDKPAIFLEITIRSEGVDVPQDETEFKDWLDASHKIVDQWFFTLCRGKLISQFESKT